MTNITVWAIQNALVSSGFIIPLRSFIIERLLYAVTQLMFALRDGTHRLGSTHDPHRTVYITFKRVYLRNHAEGAHQNIGYIVSWT